MTKDKKKPDPWVRVVLKENSTEVEFGQFEKFTIPIMHRITRAMIYKRDELKRELIRKEIIEKQKNKENDDARK